MWRCSAKKLFEQFGTYERCFLDTPDAERLPSGVPGVFCCCCCFSFLDRHHNCSCFVPAFSIWTIELAFRPCIWLLQLWKFVPDTFFWVCSLSSTILTCILLCFPVTKWEYPALVHPRNVVNPPPPPRPSLWLTCYPLCLSPQRRNPFHPARSGVELLPLTGWLGKVVNSQSYASAPNTYPHDTHDPKLKNIGTTKSHVSILCQACARTLNCLACDFLFLKMLACANRQSHGEMTLRQQLWHRPRICMAYTFHCCRHSKFGYDGCGHLTQCQIKIVRLIFFLLTRHSFHSPNRCYKNMYIALLTYFAKQPFECGHVMNLQIISAKIMALRRK